MIYLSQISVAGDGSKYVYFPPSVGILNHTEPICNAFTIPMFDAGTENRSTY